jgi:hypothetical protein
VNNLEKEFTFSTDDFQVMESGEDKSGKWIRVGGLALKEGISKNKNNYRFQNLQENDGKTFKWVVGHPKTNVEEHVVGKGKLTLTPEGLRHEGRIRNTSKHPDIVEAVQDGFLGPSISAGFKKIVKENDAYLIEGLNIKLIGFVACQGVEAASIDYAIAESFEKTESAPVDEKNKDTEEKLMEDSKPTVSVEEFKALQESHKAQKLELDRITEARKKDLAGQIVEMNKDLKVEDLIKENESTLNMRVEYEKRLAGKAAKAASVTEDNHEAKKDESKPNDEIVEGNFGCSLGEEAYRKFNAELKERVK